MLFINCCLSGLASTVLVKPLDSNLFAIKIESKMAEGKLSSKVSERYSETPMDKIMHYSRISTIEFYFQLNYYHL